MSDEPKTPVPMRAWLATPTRRGQYARFLVRGIDNSNVSQDEWLSKPADPLGWSHQPWVLFHHHSTVDALKAEVIRLGKEVEELMKVDYWQDRHNILKNQIAEIRAAWIEHQRTKFKSDGSHLQADIRLNQLLGVQDEQRGEQVAGEVSPAGVRPQTVSGESARTDQTQMESAGNGSATQGPEPRTKETNP